jgi:putative GTP pyrophosphokinase
MQSYPGSDPHALTTFLDAYASYVVEVLQPTQLEIKELLTAWQQPTYWSKYQRTNSLPIPTPVRAAISRIKRPEQVVDKIFRKPHKFPLGLVPESFQHMYDTIGVRVVVYFLSHLPLIDGELRGNDIVEIDETEPPEVYMSSQQVRTLSLDHICHAEKESGYRSVHYNVRLKRSKIPENRRPVFELQVRTAAQDLWSQLEHHLGYKPLRRTHSAAKTQLRILSQMLGAIDENFNFLYDELNRFQEEHSFAPTDPLTAERLPAVLGEIGISCAQRDINNILVFLSSRGIDTVKDVWDIATPRRIEIIRNTYLSTLGRLPFNLEVIATLAAMRGADTEDEEIQRIKLQIAYRGAWDNIRQEFVQEENS